MSENSTISGYWMTPLILSAILILAAAVRLPGLSAHGYFLDEVWDTEIATGRGSLHLHLPKNQVMAAPELLDLAGAPPWWRIWTKMEITQPPLYFLLLRLWMQVVGQSDFSGRLMSVVASLAGIVLLFDIVRLLSGRPTAIWASLLMALAEPQVEHARLVKNYALLLAFALAAADALIRIEKKGVTPTRWLALCAAILATLLTHYFCIGAIAALGIHACVQLRDGQRKQVILAFITAGFLFAICWGPFMWQQRPLFSPTETSAMFLQDHSEHHVRDSLRRFLSLPLDMLLPRQEKFPTATAAAGILYLLPLILWRRRPDLQLWALWLAFTASVVLAMDLSRNTAHLQYIRYTLLAGPAVFAMIPALVSKLKHQKWITSAVPAAMAIAAALTLPAAYHTWIVDPRTIADDIQPLIGPKDFFVSIATGDMAWKAGANYLMLSRYVRPFPCPIAILNGPPSQAVLQTAVQSNKIFAFTDVQDPRDFFPAATRRGGQMYQGQGLVWLLEHPHGNAP